MVEKMTRYSFILLSGQAEDFLEKIRELGVIDITRSHKPVDQESSAIMDKASAIQNTLKILKAADYSKDDDYGQITDAASGYSHEGDVISEASRLEDRLAGLKSELSAAEKEKKARLPWGKFDADSVRKIEDSGYTLHYYSVSKKKYDSSWEELYPLQIISEDSSSVWFVTVSPAGEAYSFPVDETAAPAGDWRESQSKIESAEKETILCKGALLKLSGQIPALEKQYGEILSELDFYLAKTADSKAVEDRISIFTGFAPTEDDERLFKAFDEMGVFYLHEAAKEEDNPPIKLKNNWFSRPFEVLTGMYGVPVYGEFDPTPVLAPFYLLFFSMCMGDAGYGLLLIAIGIFLKYKMGDSGLGKMHRLVTLLGAGTLVVGLFLGTVFGISILGASWTPEWMKSLCVDGWFPEGKIAGFPAQMVLAIGIGVIHICLAMIVKAIGYTKRFGFRNTVGTWGWTILIVGGIILAGLALAGAMSSDIIRIAVIVLGVVSGLGIFIFNTPGRSPLANFGSGLWDTYNMVTGLLGDVLSYIRLYALGLAGGMLGNAFNLMGTMILDIPVPAVNWVLCIAILVFGHVLNLAMSCLGAFVHPLRLTFVEYFKNSGYEGKGVVYNPLKQKTEIN